MTRVGVLTKYSLGYMLPGKASLSWDAGKILQMVGRARETVGEKGVSVRVDGKKDRGHERKKIGALGSPDRNNLGACCHLCVLLFMCDTICIHSYLCMTPFVCMPLFIYDTICIYCYSCMTPFVCCYL